MVGEDSGEFGFVFRLEQVFDCALWEFVERGIGGGENGEGAGSAECLGEVGGLDGGDERGEVRVSGCNGDDGFVGSFGGCVDERDQ